MTCATPGMLRMRGRIVKSASSRSSIGVARSLVTANIRTWPMIELIGPMWGCTFGGSCARTWASLSATSCRLR
jgi:hypothetical protein